MSAYVAHAGDADRDRELVISLWRGNLGQQARLEAKFDWFYRSSPWGPPLLQLLRHEPSSAWVGVAGAGTRRMLDQGRELRAGVLVDLAVNAAHRSLGPALTLQKALLHVGGERFDLLYGFPNSRAAPVFKRAGYAHLGEIVRYACVLRHRRYLELLMPPFAAGLLGFALDAASKLRAFGRDRGLTYEWVASVDPRVDELWSQSEHGAALIAPRDTAMLHWRFDRSPSRTVRYLLVSAKRCGSLLAWFACEVDGTTLHVRDFWSVDAARGIGRRLIAAMLIAARRSGQSSVSVEYAGPGPRHRAWLDAGFVARSRRPIFGLWNERSPHVLHLTSADEDE